MSLGARLRSERIRLGLNQTDFAAIADASKRAMVSWEKDDTSPSASALVRWAEHGMDAAYVLTGSRSGSPSRLEAAQDYELKLDELEDRLERHAIGLVDFTDDEMAVVRRDLEQIAMSKTPHIGSTYRERADDLLRNHFSDDAAAKRRQARFSQRGRLTGQAEAQLNDILAGLQLQLPPGIEVAVIGLMLNYKIHPNDLVPLFVDIGRLYGRIHELENR